ncbi:type II secretion system F family protein [Salsipaludibacter albus]|uniref:type II secretion system F family protein n=1 Tax=Salsipaludibacter albus TaxID=2849650 RepID=UPI001EE47231|nr:type II secretion system F family protein [Salsipaludibacter albus]MBY5162900.1 type II secretion system F family protein [Salsipaludibacter albus]
MDPMLLLALAAAAIGVAIIFGVAIDTVMSRRAVNRSLRAATWDDAEIAQVRQRELAVPATQRIFVPALQRVGRGVGRFAPASVVERLDLELTYAGGSTTWDGERVLAVKFVLAVGLPIVTALGLPWLGFGGLVVLVGVGLMAAVGWYAPEWILRSRSGRRQHAIQRALPDALDLLSITVEAGLGFDAALDRVAREVRGPLGGEMYRVVQEMRLGRARADALRSLAERTDVEELNSFVLAMIQADIFGISVAQVLHVQADELRIKRRQRAEEEAQKLPVKIIFPLLFGIFPALFVILLGPAAISIYENVIQR